MKTLDIELKNRQKKDPYIIPAVIYGHNIKDSIPCEMNRKEFIRLVKSNGRNIILNCIMDDGTKHKALIKEIQKDVLTLDPIHVDFMAISLDKDIEITIPIHTSGESIGEKMGGMLEQVTFKITIKGKPDLLPENITIDLTNYDIGTHLHASDLTLEKGIDLISAVDAAILSITAPHVEVVESTDAAATGAPAPAAVTPLVTIASAPEKVAPKFPSKKKR
jgi:large subunit ribosomal protein L25